jgi:hypothetical protein
MASRAVASAANFPDFQSLIGVSTGFGRDRINFAGLAHFISPTGRFGAPRRNRLSRTLF